MTDITAVLISTFISGFLFLRADWYLLSKGFVPVGTIVMSIFTITYGLGWFLWRIDPDSLFGYSSLSTLSALHGMGSSFALGIVTLAFVYCLVRLCTIPDQQPSLLPKDLYVRNSSRLVPFVVIMLVLSVVLVPYLYDAGMFTRQVGVTSQHLSSAETLVSLAKATTFLSRLLPVAIILLPVAFSDSSRFYKLLILCALTAFVCMAYYTGSRTLLFTVPVYMLIGYIFWYRPKPRNILVVIALLLSLLIPVAEHVRVQREGNPAVPDLRIKYQLFQIGKQLIGTSHDFYLYLDSKSCLADLSQLMATDPLTREISQLGARSFAPESFQRWHISGRLAACSSRSLTPRLWSSLDRFPAGLLPKTLGFSAPSLFDGQELSHELSRTLDLKPGEISNSTLSLFADSWWRYRWFGVIIAFSVFGLLLALIQAFIDYQTANGAVAGLLSQLVLFTLLGSWINNTALTTLWLLFWELPKTLFILYLLVVFIGHARRVFRSQRL